MNERVSVIVPYVTADAYLAQMKVALQAQTWPAIETIFVEDAARRGPSWARNRGLARATGDIVLFADVDDDIARDWVARMVEGLGEADVGWSAFTRVDATGRTREPSREEAPRLLRGNEIVPYFFARVFGYRLRDLAKALLPGGLWKNCSREWAGVWRLAIRRARFSSLRFDERLRLYEDAMFIARLAQEATSVRVFGDAGYTWVIRAEGSMCREAREHVLANKFAVRDARRAIDPAMRYWSGSFLLSACEIFKTSGAKMAWCYLKGESYDAR